MGRIVFFLTLIAAGLAIALFVFDGGVPTGGQTYAQSSGNFGLRQTTSPDASTASPLAAVSTPVSASPSQSPINRCVNMGGALEAENEGDWGYTIRRSDFTRIRAMGFDTVRIPVKWSAHADPLPPYRIDPSLFTRVDTVAKQAIDAGLQPIIDVHHYDDINEDPKGHTPRLMAIWKQISEHYANWPDDLIFELLNEPHTELTAKRIDKLNRALLRQVRETNPDRWVILGGGNWGSLEGLMATTPPYDPRAIVTFHYYEPFEFTHQGAPWAWKKVPLGQTWGTSEDRQDVVAHLTAAARWQEKVGMPVFLGEFGVYVEVDDTQRAQYVEFVRRTSERLGMGWCYWDWGTTLGMYNLERETLHPGFQTALFAD